MKRKTLISIPLVLAIIISLFGGLATGASATTVTDMSEYILSSAVPTSFSVGTHTASTGSVTSTDGGINSTRTFTLSGTSGTGDGYTTGTGFYFTLPSLYTNAVGSNASAKPYILHLSYRIQNDRTNPADFMFRIQYQTSSSKGAPKDIFYSNGTQLTMIADNSLNITSANSASYNNLDFYDYKVDFYENMKTGAYQIYINGVKWISAYDYSTVKDAFGSSSYTFNSFRIFVKQTGAAYSFNLVNPCYELYSEDVMMDEVIAYSVSGMSNYLNTTAGEPTSSAANRGSGSFTVTGVTGTVNTNGGYTSYTFTGVTSGSYISFYAGNYGSSGGHRPLLNSYATDDKAWYHIGYNINGNNNADVTLQMNINYWSSSSGSSSGTGTQSGVIPAYTGSNYRADFFFDLKNHTVYIYYDNTFVQEKNTSLGTRYQFRQIRIASSTAVDFTMSNMVFEYYANGVTPGDMFMGYDERTKTTYDYVYQIDGIKSGTNVIGKVDGLCSVTGDNTNGYTIKPTSVNATNGGFARFYLGYTSDTGIFQRDTDRVLHQTFYYKPAAVSTEQTIGMRGGTSSLQGYKYFLYANPSTGDFEDTDRNRIKSYDTNTFYKIDIIVNCCDFKYYFLLDGVCIESGTLYFQPIWQIVYTSRSTSDYMVIKNMQTTLYKDNYTLLDKVKPLLERIYAKVESCSVSDGTATVTTSYIANTTNSATANTKVIYGIYNSAGSLLKYQAVNDANTYVNGSNLTQSVTIPTDGTTLKVFMWNMNLGSGDLTPIANQITKSLQ